MLVVQQEKFKIQRKMPTFCPLEKRGHANFIFCMTEPPRPRICLFTTTQYDVGRPRGIRSGARIKAG